MNQANIMNFDRVQTANRKEIAVHAQNLSKTFGDVTALNGIDLEVETGAVMGLLGPNGAGKTTTVRILTTLLRPDGGSAIVGGYDVLEEPQAVRNIIGLSGQNTAVDDTLTGRENLVMVGRLYHMGYRRARQRADELLELFSLTDSSHRQTKEYSGGMMRRLDLAASVIAKPKILFLDEPSSGLDPRGRLELWKVIKNLVYEGMTLLLTTQYMEEADQLADRIAVIDRGSVIALGTSTELKERTGGNFLTVQLVDPIDLSQTAVILNDTGIEPPNVDSTNIQVSVCVEKTGPALTDVVRKLDAAGIKIANIALREPTLDDVFLATTGRKTVIDTAHK